MQRDGDGDGDAQTRVLKRRQECGQALGEIVDPNGQGREQSHAQELRIVNAVVVGAGGSVGRIGRDGVEVWQRSGIVVKWLDLLLRVRLVRVLCRRDHVVDDSNEEDSREKRGRVDPVSPVIPVGDYQSIGAFDKNLHKRHVQHHAR